MFVFLREVGEEEEELVKAFYGELALATENAFQNALMHLLSMPGFSSALGLLEFLVEGEGMSMAAGDKASPDRNLKVSGAPGSPKGLTFWTDLPVSESPGNV